MESINEIYNLVSAKEQTEYDRDAQHPQAMKENFLEQ
jgi:hypothetical protein